LCAGGYVLSIDCVLERMSDAKMFVDCQVESMPVDCKVEDMFVGCKVEGMLVECERMSDAKMFVDCQVESMFVERKVEYMFLNWKLESLSIAKREKCGTHVKILVYLVSHPNYNLRRANYLYHLKNLFFLHFLSSNNIAYIFINKYIIKI